MSATPERAVTVGIEESGTEGSNAVSYGGDRKWARRKVTMSYVLTVPSPCSAPPQRVIEPKTGASSSPSAASGSSRETRGDALAIDAEPTSRHACIGSSRSTLHANGSFEPRSRTSRATAVA